MLVSTMKAQIYPTLKEDSRFKMLHNTLNNVSRKLHKSGIGTVKAQARVITTKEEETLWTTGVVGIPS